MRIIRSLDASRQIWMGREHNDGSVTLVEGDLLKGFRDTGKKQTVQKRLAPVTPPAILCIGLNYHRHAAETGMEIPDRPILFMKNPATLCHPQDPVIIPRSCIDPPQVDYEAELAVVIGRPAKNVSVHQAFDHVAGYSAANDISARRWQKHGGGGQWVRGKSFDTFCPLGPCLVTPDDLPDPQNLQISCTLNREIMQAANTADMIFSVAELVSALSESMTLLTGSVILTGTPSGVGFTRRPPVYLKPGDEIAVSIDGVGTLSNPVSSEALP